MALSKRQFVKVLKKRSLITYHNPKSLIAEQLRTIRTNLQFIIKNRHIRTLIITSAGLGEGKTTTTANLGISLAEQGNNVLIVDADIRKPGLHTLFKYKNSIGLVNVLNGETLLEDAINHTEIERLDLLTSGPMPYIPARLINSSAIKAMLKKAIEKYDFILFDSPPVMEVADSKIIGNLCDGVILVVQHGKTQQVKAYECNKILELAGANIIGTILNEKK